MARLELNEKESAVLVEILQSALTDLRTERLRTERRDLHAAVLERENFLESVLAKLEGRA